MSIPVPLLPPIPSHEAFATYATHSDAGLEAARAIAKRHAFVGEVERFSTGAMLVFRVGEARVIKLYPTLYARKYAVEKASLRLVENKLPIATPAIVADGEFDGWCYLGITLLRGASIDSLFNEIDPPSRVELLRVLGTAVAKLHAIEIPTGSTLSHNWNDYVTTQLNGAADRQRRLGLDDRYVEQIPHFLSRFESELRKSDTQVLLHTELGPSHVLVDRLNNTWNITGLFDFGDAFLGPAEFDLPAVALFVARGDRTLFREFLRSYSRSLIEGDKRGSFPERMLAFALIHKYSNLSWYLKEIPVDVEDARLESLATAWFEAS